MRLRSFPAGCLLPAALSWARAGLGWGWGRKAATLSSPAAQGAQCRSERGRGRKTTQGTKTVAPGRGGICFQRSGLSLPVVWRAQTGGSGTADALQLCLRGPSDPHVLLSVGHAGLAGFDSEFQPLDSSD